ncbi:MAG: hypothetical protein E7005_07590 [Alphaproteobacteria bacterium]|nr:hypothetical protein [Alphaproteobacteria bacterium]
MKKKKSICFGNIKYFLSHDKIRVSFFNIPIVKIKFYNNYSVFFLFYFFPIWLIKLQYKKIDIKLDTKNFNNINIDDTNLINELSDIGEFTYIPNPGNMGDMLIAAATLQFFKKHNLKFNIYNGTNIAKTVVYGGGGSLDWKL